MPSAQQNETGEAFTRSTDPRQVDLHSLLHAMGASSVIHLSSLHGRGKVLFAEGEPARGIYILRSGQASVSISSSEGRIVTLRMARAGAVLGLNAALRNATYDTTVKALQPCRTDFIPRADLMELLATSEAGNEVILNLLSQELAELTERTRSLLLPQTASARFAKLLLEWSGHTGRIDRVFTHEDVSQMICSSRETVTRLLANVSRRNIVEITSDSLVIRDRPALERMALS